MLERGDLDPLRILQLVNDSDIATVRFRSGDTEIVVSRVEGPLDGGAAVETTGPATASETPAIEPAPAAAPDAPAADAAPSVSPANGRVTIDAPMIGAFYRAQDPAAAPYVQVGDTVAPDTTVGLIEAMKVFTAVPAGVDGVVTEVLVENAEMVEFGQPLFAVAPRETAGGDA